MGRSETKLSAFLPQTEKTQSRQKHGHGVLNSSHPQDTFTLPQIVQFLAAGTKKDHGEDPPPYPVIYLYSSWVARSPQVPGAWRETGRGKRAAHFHLPLGLWVPGALGQLFSDASADMGRGVPASRWACSCSKATS